ncbi:MAG: glycyl-radical enzyme activating protein, partial [Candidatus Heimdallarchaeaceae archaeon]
MSDSGYIFDIKKFAIHDGPGIRTTVFLKGCSMDCWWCHNPESQNLKPEEIEKANHHNVQEIIGRKISVEEVLEEIEKDMIFYEESGGGVTFSGGEALTQPEFLFSLLKGCKDKNIHTILDTTGYTKWEILEKISSKVDLFLYDLKIINDNLHQKYTGVSNKLILENLQKLNEITKKIIIRVPIIPKITDTEENLTQISDIIKNLNSIQRVDILPYNKMGEEKYRRLNREYRTNEIVPPTEERMEEIKVFLE